MNAQILNHLKTLAATTSMQAAFDCDSVRAARKALPYGKFLTVKGGAFKDSSENNWFSTELYTVASMKFTCAHRITKATVAEFGGDYSATFSASLKIVNEFFALALELQAAECPDFQGYTAENILARSRHFKKWSNGPRFYTTKAAAVQGYYCLRSDTFVETK